MNRCFLGRLQRKSRRAPVLVLNLTGVSVALAVGAAAYADVQFIESEMSCSASCLDISSRPVANGPVPTASRVQADPAVRAKYERLVRHWEKTNRAEHYLQFFTLELPASMAKGVLGEIPVLGSMAGDAIDKGIEEIKSAREERARRILRSSLIEIENEGRVDEFLEQDGPGRLALAEDALRKLGALTQDENLFDKITSPGQRDELQNSAIRLLTEGLTQTQAAVAANVQEIGNLQGQIAKLSERVTALEDAETTRKEAAANLTMQTAAVDDVSDPLEKQQAEHARRASVREFLKKSKVASDQLDAAAGILDEVGAPEAARAVNFASGATQLAAGIALSTVDPTAILPTVLGGLKFMKAFGGGGEADPIAAQLSQILRLQKRILERLVEIEELIEENHREVMTAISVVNSNVLAIYDQLREEPQRRLARCGQIVRPDSFYPANHPDQAGFVVAFQPTRFESFEDFFDHAAANESNIEPCMDALSEFFTVPNGLINNTFLLSEVRLIDPGETQGRVEVFLRELAEETHAFVAGSFSEESLLGFALVASTPDLLHQVIEMSEPVSDEISEIDRVNFLANLGRTLSPISVRRYGSWLVGTHFYFELTGARFGVINRDAVLNREGPIETTGRDLLEVAASIVDVAIAQQNLHAGGPLLPVGYAAWLEDRDSHLTCDNWVGSSIVIGKQEACSRGNQETFATDLRKAFFGAPEEPAGLLARNALLARNLALYGVTRRLEERSRTKLSYDVAYNATRNASLLKRVLGEDWDIRWRSEEEAGAAENAGWNVLINGIAIPLPKPEQVYRGTFAIQPELVGLIDLRRRISEEIAGYRIFSQEDTPAALDRDQRQLAKEFMVAGASPF